MKSMGGSNEKHNIVLLTAREHFLAHWLLWRIHKNKSSAIAFFLMCRKNDGTRIKSTRAYAEAKEARRGENHPNFGKRHSEQTKLKIRSNSPFLGLSGPAHPSYGIKRSKKSVERGAERRSKGIISIDKFGNILEFKSIKEASEITGICKGNICSACKGNLTQAGGYSWKYKNII